MEISATVPPQRSIMPTYPLPVYKFYNHAFQCVFLICVSFVPAMHFFPFHLYTNFYYSNGPKVFLTVVFPCASIGWSFGFIRAVFLRGVGELERAPDARFGHFGRCCRPQRPHDQPTGMFLGSRIPHILTKKINAVSQRTELFRPNVWRYRMREWNACCCPDFPSHLAQVKHCNLLRNHCEILFLVGLSKNDQATLATMASSPGVKTPY